MNSNPYISVFLGRLGTESPMLLVYLTGMILALVFWRRCPGPSLMTLIAMILLLVTTVSLGFSQAYFLQARVEKGWTNDTYSHILWITGFLGSFMHAIAFALLFGAIFSGRAQRAPSPAPYPGANRV